MAFPIINKWFKTLKSQLIIIILAFVCITFVNALVASWYYYSLMDNNEQIVQQQLPLIELTDDLLDHGFQIRQTTDELIHLTNPEQLTEHYHKLVHIIEKFKQSPLLQRNDLEGFLDLHANVQAISNSALSLFQLRSLEAKNELRLKQNIIEMMQNNQGLTDSRQIRINAQSIEEASTSEYKGTLLHDLLSNGIIHHVKQENELLTPSQVNLFMAQLVDGISDESNKRLSDLINKEIRLHRAEEVIKNDLHNQIEELSHIIRINIEKLINSTKSNYNVLLEFAKFGYLLGILFLVISGLLAICVLWFVARKSMSRLVALSHKVQNVVVAPEDNTRQNMRKNEISQIEQAVNQLISAYGQQKEMSRALKLSDERMQSINETLELANDALMDANIQYMESEKLFRDIAKSASDWFWQMDKHYRIVSVSEQFYLQTQLTAEQIIGKTIEELLELGILEIKKHIFAEFLMLLRQHQPFKQLNITLKTSNSKTFYISCSGVATFNNNQEFCGYRGCLTNVTQETLLRRDLEFLANTDVLTDTHNRRQFWYLANLEIARVARYQNTFTILLMDIDHFKKINDQYGHDVGDKALIEFAKVCKLNMRTSDILARIGGEEFALLLPETQVVDAFIVAERIRNHVAKHNIQISELNINITVSIGLTQSLADDQNIEAVLVRADKALYQAKDKGRNCSIIYS